MFRSNFKIAYRSLMRSKAHSAINISGLAIGIAFSCMLYLYISNELSYDSFHTKSDRIYRTLTIDERIPDKPRIYGQGMPPLGPALKDDFPEVVDMVRLYRFQGQIVFQIGDVNHQEREWYSTEANFFEVFDFPFVFGDPGTALAEPFSAVLTESSAIRYFGQTDIIGKTLETEANPIKITGVIRDQPENSHLKFNILVSSIRPDDRWKTYLSSWDRFGTYTYIVLDDKSSIESLVTKTEEFESRYWGSFGDSFSLDFQNIEDIYFKSEQIEAGTEASRGQISYIYIFTTMGLFILIIACINYINLATSKAMFRAREIGIRKVVGAHKRQLVAQFLTESFLVTAIGLVVAVAIMDLAFPYFNRITTTQFDINLNTIGDYAPSLLGLALIIAILSGGYPAFYLSQLRPAATLKGQDESGKRSAILRKGLVVFQFVLTIVMLVSTLVIGKQLNFIEDKDIGFNKEKLAVIDINSWNVRGQFQTMKNELLNIPGVASVGVSSRVPGEWKNIHQLYMRSSDSPDGGVDSVRTYFMGFDDGMLETYKFEMVQGNYFGPNSQNDSTKILINEAAMETFGLADPIGAVLKRKTDGELVSLTVIGVVKNFHFQSLHEKISPLVIGAWNNPFRVIDYFTLKVSGDMAQVLTAANKVHEKFDEHTPMEVHFLDQQLESFYEKEARAGMIFRMGAGLCIFVACLGLFGLASFTVMKRTKELGIRKILGANQTNLFLLLSSSFTKQIGIAFIIASPIAYYIMNNWLQVFEYRVSLGLGVFLLAGIMAVFIALITISYRSIKAIRSNPVDSLRYE